MWVHRPTLPVALFSFSAAFVAFRYRCHLLRLFKALVPWKGSSAGEDPSCGEQHLCRYVLNNSVHGQPESVMLTFDQWTQELKYVQDMAHVCVNLLGPVKGVFLDDVVARVAPSTVLELGTYCGYSAIRMLRLLPPGGKLYTVEQCSHVADMAEEMILVAGFKNTQFQLLVLSSNEAIATMKTNHGVNSFDLVLMDHSPEQFLTDLHALKGHGLLSPGTTILANDVENICGREFLHEVQNDRYYRIQKQCDGLIEIVCTPITSSA